jgi:hypothetical protein
MAQHFRMGWSPRLKRQARAFVPVVIAAGGSPGEALDHLVAMRILRKIRDRHATRVDDIDALRAVFDKPWSAFSKKYPATRCIDLLNAETKRVERDLA